MYKSTLVFNLEWALNGIKLEWSPDSGVGDVISILYGQSTDDNYFDPYVTLVTKRVTTVEVHATGSDVAGLRFGHPDGTKTTTPKTNGVPSATATNFYAIQGNFIGLDVVFDSAGSSGYVANTKIAFWDDIGGNPCVTPSSLSFTKSDDAVYFLNQS